MKPTEDGGLVNGDTGEVDPRGFPYFRRVGEGVETIGLRLPLLSPESQGTTFEVCELDLAADETPLRFQAQGDPLADFHADNSLRGLVMRAVTEHQPWLYEAWLRHGPELLEDVEPFTIAALDDLEA